MRHKTAGVLRDWSGGGGPHGLWDPRARQGGGAAEGRGVGVRSLVGSFFGWSLCRDTRTESYNMGSFVAR